jgi:hypothetical protein
VSCNNVESEKHRKARDWLMKSGYGLEMRAAAVCRKHHLLPTQSVHYQDPTHMERQLARLMSLFASAIG